MDSPSSPSSPSARRAPAMPSLPTLKPDKSGDYRTSTSCFSGCTQKADPSSSSNLCGRRRPDMSCFAALKPDKTGDYRTGLGCFSGCTFESRGGESFLKSCLQYHSQSLPASLAHEFLVEGIRHAHVLVPSVLSVDGFRTGGIPVRLVQDWPPAGKINRSACMETSSSSPIFVHPIAAMIDAISDIETLSIAPFRY